MANDKDSMGIISVRAQKELIERGKQAAAKRGFSLSDMVRMLLIEELERIESLKK